VRSSSKANAPANYADEPLGLELFRPVNLKTLGTPTKLEFIGYTNFKALNF
jgi:hypothetical protein